MKKSLLFFLLLFLTLPVFGQTSKTGRIELGTLAARPLCINNGDQYTAVDQIPVTPFLCSNGSWIVPGSGTTTFTGGNVANAVTFQNTVSFGANATFSTEAIAGNVSGFIYVDGIVFTTFQNAVTAAAITSSDVFVPPGVYTIGSNFTVPDNVKCYFSAGANLSVNSLVTLTYLGGIDAGRYQIFSGAGIVRFKTGTTGNKRIKNYIVEWWGAVADNSTNSGAAIQAANDAVGASFTNTTIGGVLDFSFGTYYLGTTNPAVTIGSTLGLTADGNITWAGNKDNIGTFLRYGGTGTAIRVFNATGLPYNVNFDGISIVGTIGVTSNRGLSLEGLSQFYARNIGLGDVNSDSSFAGFTDCLYAGYAGIGYVDNLEATGCTNAIHLDQNTVQGGSANATLNFSNLDLFNNSVMFRINNAINVKVSDSWFEWANSFLVIDNNGTNGATADIENLTFDNVHFVNGPTSPFQGGQLINIQASNHAVGLSLRSIKFENSQFIQNSASAGTVVANSIRIAVSTASSLLIDQPIQFINDYVAGGNAAAISVDSSAVKVLSKDSTYFKDEVIGGFSTSTFTGSGSTGEMDQNSSGHIQFFQPTETAGIINTGPITLNGSSFSNTPSFFFNCNITTVQTAPVSWCVFQNLDKPITIIRMGLVLQSPASGCSTSPIVGLLSTAATMNVPNSVFFIDSGALSVNLAAGTYTVGVLNTDSGCSSQPTGVNLSILYKMQ